MFASRATSVVVFFTLSYTVTQADYKAESDFSEVVKKATFVDKTSYIKDLLSGPDSVVLRAPPRSGKSSALDMVRRFVEVQVDAQGRPLPPNTTDSYALFHDRGLGIAGHGDVVDRHLARHPVLTFDLQSLGAMVSHYDVLDTFKRWLREAHARHSYLLHERNLWVGPHEQSHFEELMRKSNIKYAPSYMIQKFTRLCELLFIHFQKPIFTLVDDYDAFLDSPDISFNFSNDYVVSFIHNFSTEFFQKNKYLGKVFITGVHRERSPLPEFKFSFPPKTVFYNYTDKHPLCQMLGSY